MPSLALSNTLFGKPHVSEKSGLAVYQQPHPFLRHDCFLALFVYFHIKTLVMEQSEQFEIWTGCTVGIVS